MSERDYDPNRPLARFVPVRREERDIDLNGFCPQCHEVATSWGRMYDRMKARLAEYQEALEHYADLRHWAIDRHPEYEHPKFVYIGALTKPTFVADEALGRGEIRAAPSAPPVPAGRQQTGAA